MKKARKKTFVNPKTGRKKTVRYGQAGKADHELNQELQRAMLIVPEASRKKRSIKKLRQTPTVR